jgi:uncharacterized protein (DUF58 family)
MAGLAQTFTQWLAPVWDPLAAVPDLDPPPRFAPTAEALLKRLTLSWKRPPQAAPFGEQASLFRGQGLDFLALRPYQPGDDIRKLDWNVYARTFSPYVREHQEEKQLTVWLVLDWTPSMYFGQTLTKAHQALDLAGLLGWLAHQHGHRLGVYGFSGTDRLILQPQQGYAHLQATLQQVCDATRRYGDALPQFPSADRLQQVCQEIPRLISRRAVVFFLSDFLDTGWETALAPWASSCRPTFLVLHDPVEDRLPAGLGCLPLVDAESGRTGWGDTSDPKWLAAYQTAAEQAMAERLTRLRRLGGVCPVATTADPKAVIQDLLALRRERRA